VEAVTLNAFVCELVTERGVDRLDPRSCESEILRGRGFPSSEPRASRNVVEGVLSSYVCRFGSTRRRRRSLDSFFRGFRARIPRGLAPFLRRVLVPLIPVPDNVAQPNL
jgi:hypothetical protein